MNRPNLHIGILAPDLTMKHGWAQYSLSLIQALRKLDVRMTVVAASNSPSMIDVDVHPILPALVPRERAFTVKMMAQVPAVRRILHNCDVVHALAEPFAPLGAWVAGPRPLVVTGHGSYVRMAEHERWPFSLLYRRAFLQSTLICVSHYTEKVAQAALPGVRTAVVNNGVDASRFAGITHTPDDPPFILAVGAVKPRKGQLELVKAMPKVLEQFPNARCVIIGSLTAEPAYVQQIKDTIAALDLSKRVLLFGHVSEDVLLDYYRRATLFALPSMNDGWRFEGYGLVHLEASAAGLPVIGTTDCGAEDAIDNEVTGLLVSQAQVAVQLPEAIIRLLSNPSLAARMGAAGREKAARQTWATVAQELIGVYNQVVG
ncbi:MAG: glycosyltransferase family 4 protein [Chloroflexi bacterium]|nr:glycosyltransferase family 4 protein [Chloroflexota bacterium]